MASHRENGLSTMQLSKESSNDGSHWLLVNHKTIFRIFIMIQGDTSMHANYAVWCKLYTFPNNNL